LPKEQNSPECSGLFLFWQFNGVSRPEVAKNSMFESFPCVD